MKNLARCFYIFLAIMTYNNAYAQEWIPYQGQHIQSVIQTTNTIQQSIPYVYQPVINYQYVPYIVNHPVVIEHRCLFYKTQKIIYFPQVQYFYQPVVIYK